LDPPLSSPGHVGGGGNAVVLHRLVLFLDEKLNGDGLCVPFFPGEHEVTVCHNDVRRVD
jgi:hypothetical protein